MWRSGYQYYAAFELPEGGRVGDVSLEVDWIPALRWAEFEQDLVHDSPPENRFARSLIEPLWSPEGNPPYVSGVRIRRSEAGNESVEFPLSYFASSVIQASGQLVASGALAAGQRFDYKVFALADSQLSPAPDSGVTVTAAEEPLAIERIDMAPFMTAVESHAGSSAAPSSSPSAPISSVMPIFIPQQALDEATELAEAAGEVETGGILVGKLCRDSNHTLFCRVTAQIPAEHTSATRHSLRFTPATWVSVEAAIKLRGKGEIPLGWWHKHPYFCVKCSPEQRALCPFSAPAFSAADRDFHREVFQKPWSIALLLSFLGGERPSYDVFAWSQGRIEAANYHTLPGTGGIPGEST